jgi:hypothetical protein
VIAVADGNRVFLAACWRETDTIQATRQFIAEFERLKLLPGSIYGDEGGLGCVMCDALKEAGWRMNRVNNGAAAKRRSSLSWISAPMRISNPLTIACT